MKMLLILFCLAVLTNGQPISNQTYATRCRTKEDFERIPWLMSTSNFHNFGHPLIKALCRVAGSARREHHLGCKELKGVHWPHTSDNSTRFGPQTSKVIIDPHMRDLGSPSAGAFVILSMFGLLRQLGYEPGVRHWSNNLYNLFEPAVANAAMEYSKAYDKYLETGTGNPFQSSPNYIAFQVEVGLNFLPDAKPINSSPYGRQFRWAIGLHFKNKVEMYVKNTQLSHCIGANHYLGRGHLCSSAGVIPCPQYKYHQERSREVTPENRASLKRNIILVDSDQGDLDYEDLERDIKRLGGVDDLRVLVHQGRKREQTVDLYKSTKITFDCRNPGVEFINYEAVLYDVLTVSCNARAVRNVFDFPVPSKYHVETSDWKKIVHTLHGLLLNYESHVQDFEPFKRMSQCSTEMSLTQLDMHFFSRDVMFRTHCSTYAQCRRALPWAVAVWTLFPLARIEVLMDVSVEQFEIDNDLILDTLTPTFNSKYFRAYYRDDRRKHPADLFPSFPCTYMVYMDCSFVPFSRDFLNTHIAAIASDPAHRSIVHWHGDKMVLAVMAAKPYMLVIRESTQARTFYVETNFQIRAIANMDTLGAIQAAIGNAVKITGNEYLKSLPIGQDFWQTDMAKILADSPTLPATPCNGTTSAAANVSIECYMPSGLIIDALFIPEMPTKDDDVVDSSTQTSAASTHSTAIKSAGPLTKPHFWLTSSTPRIPVAVVLDTFSQAEKEEIVKHLDPILQNAQMQKILGFVPEDISRVLKHFDAVLFPNVVSLIDADNQHWGEKQCKDMHDVL